MGKILYRKEKNEDNILCRMLLLMVKGKGNNYIPNSDYACRTRKKKKKQKPDQRILLQIIGEIL